MKILKREMAFLCIIACLAFLMSGCSGQGGESGVTKDIDLDAVCESLIKELDYPEMADVSERYDTYYSVPDNTVKECRLFVCSSGAYPDELAVFVLNRSDDKEKLKTAINARKDYLLETWEDYKPEEVPKIENAKFLEYSGYCFYLISDNTGKASEILSQYFS